MRVFIAVTVLALTVAQVVRGPFTSGRESDRHAGYTFEYHSRHNLLLVSDRRNCYLIDAQPDVISVFHSRDQQDALEDDIIEHIESEDISQRETQHEALTQFHDVFEANECRRKRIYELSYTLNSSLAVVTIEVGTTTTKSTTTA